MSKQKRQPKCEARTNSGKRCKENSLSGKRYCHKTSHQKQIEELSKMSMVYYIKRFLKIIITLISLIAFIIALVSGIFSLVSKVSVAEGEILERNNPISSRFTVRNDNNWGIKDIKISCGIHNIEAGGARLSGFSYDRRNQRLPVLYPNQATTFTCEKLLPADRITQLVISVDVSYRPAWSLFKKMHSQQFTAERNTNGDWHWIPGSLLR